jgi:hypothetical protein
VVQFEKYAEGSLILRRRRSLISAQGWERSDNPGNLQTLNRETLKSLSEKSARADRPKNLRAYLPCNEFFDGDE